MDVTVGQIDRRAGEFARAFGRLPRGGVADFVDRLGVGRGSHRFPFTPLPSAAAPGLLRITVQAARLIRLIRCF